jgi:hypothetical protein
LEARKEYAFLIRGLHTIAHVTTIFFEGEADYLQELDRLLITASSRF